MPPPEEHPTFLIRYGEIGIKSLPVRRRFERLLGQNILRGLRARGAEGELTTTWGRLFLRAPDAPARATLQRTFGIVSFSPVRKAPSQLDALAGFVGNEAGIIPPRSSFAVRARRSGEPGYTSQDVAKAVGASVLQLHRSRGLHVDLDEPDVEVLVEVRNEGAWVAFERVAGPGGLPVASEGRVSAWLATPRDALAAWMAMKRGCRVDLLAPVGVDRGLATALAAWDPGLELVEVDAPAHDRALVLAMLAAHTRRRKGSAVVVGDGFDACLALAPLDRTIAVPVFRPLLALEPAMVDATAAMLGVRLQREEAPPPQPAPGADLAERAAGLLRGTQRMKVMP